MFTKKPKFAADALVVAVDGCLTRGTDGRDYIIAAGMSFRGSHPAVQAQPQFFVPDGTTDDEVFQARAALRLGSA
jgi:hypothetical protein